MTIRYSSTEGGITLPKRAKELSAIEIRRLDRVGFYSVGGVAGLHLQVTSINGRSWILRTVIGSRRRDIGLGSYPEVSLAEARNKARETKKMIREGIDPILERKLARERLIAEQAKAISFRECAEGCHGVKAKEFRSDKYSQDWINSLKTHVFPVIGDMGICDIDTPHMLQVLKPIWTDKTVTASRVRRRIKDVIDYAISSGFRDGANPARWKGHLSTLLPLPSKIKSIQHFPALPYQKMPEFMNQLINRKERGAQAVQFAILTCARSGEARSATWSEIDLESSTWTIPKDRMKAKKTHRVPLSDHVMSILNSLERTNDLIFPSMYGKVMDYSTLSLVIKKMHKASLRSGGDGFADNSGAFVTLHGFRSTFKDWARNMCANIPDEVSELCLAHVNSDATRVAYARDGLMEQRRALLEKWSEFCMH